MIVKSAVTDGHVRLVLSRFRSLQYDQAGAGRIGRRRSMADRMALTPSTMAALGARAPDFTLPDARGNPVWKPGNKPDYCS